MNPIDSVNIPKLSVLSLLYRWRQYFSLFLVCVFGIGVSFFFNFLVSGMLDALTQKSKIFYGGEYQFLSGAGGMRIYDRDYYLNELRNVFPDDAIVAARIDYDARESCAIYFEGAEVFLRVIKGVDFTTEEKLFENFSYVSGSAKNLYGTNGILISEKIAKRLQCNVGDSLTLMLETEEGYTNTVEVVVEGIFRDSSVFGVYTTYVDFEFLRQSVGYPKNFANRMNIYLPNRTTGNRDLKKYHKALSEKINMYRITYNKDEFYDEGKSDMFALIPLEANMRNLQIIIDAMKLVTVLIIIALVAIIVIGISSTYRVIVMKRINEIGIYKAIGMEQKSIYGLLLIETTSLIVAGSVFALIIYFGAAALIQCFDFSFIPAFDVFLVAGRAVPVFDLKSALLIFIAVLVTTLGAVMFSVREAVKKMPCEALLVTE